jgi:hypothetical protein
MRDEHLFCLKVQRLEKPISPELLTSGPSPECSFASVTLPPREGTWVRIHGDFVLFKLRPLNQVEVPLVTEQLAKA